MRTIFFGTPEIAVPALEALAETTELCAVVCQPDRPSGRGLSLHAPPIKRVAERLGVEVHQPVKVKTGNLHEWIAERRPDVAVVMAYGRILPEAVLQAPAKGCINLHASLLPRWRGAAPIQWAILHGDSETGVSLMQMDAGMDTGPVYAERRIPIGDEETAGQLAERIAALAAEVVRLDLPRAVSGELTARPQDDSGATFAPPITSDDARVDWARPAVEIVRRIRAMAPRPGAHTRVRGKSLRVLSAALAPEPAAGAPGTVAIVGKRRLIVATGAGSLELRQAQLEGKKALAAADLINGRTLANGDVLG